MFMKHRVNSLPHLVVSAEKIGVKKAIIVGSCDVPTENSHSGMGNLTKWLFTHGN